MELTLAIQKAINTVSRLHFGQKRKGDGNIPYISHPFSVAWILANHTSDEDIILAGLFHDVLEDVDGYEYEDLVRDCGKRVADIVKVVSEDKTLGTGLLPDAAWKERKRMYIRNIQDDIPEALYVSAADKIHNIRSIMLAYDEKGEALWDHFKASPRDHLWFVSEVAAIIRSRIGGRISDDLDREVERFSEICCR
jgi:(p)ppGpp synthase/HD superfamily hydrolase